LKNQGAAQDGIKLILSVWCRFVQKTDELGDLLRGGDKSPPYKGSFDVREIVLFPFGFVS
jgi:hypothetical protein